MGLRPIPRVRFAAALVPPGSPINMTKLLVGGTSTKAFHGGGEADRRRGLAWISLDAGARAQRFTRFAERSTMRASASTRKLRGYVSY